MNNQPFLNAVGLKINELDSRVKAIETTTPIAPSIDIGRIASIEDSVKDMFTQAQVLGLVTDISNLFKQQIDELSARVADIERFSSIINSMSAQIAALNSRTQALEAVQSD